MQYGDKLIFKENKDIIEVTGVFPASQGFRIESGEKYLSVSIAGRIAYLPEELINAIMEKHIPVPIKIEKTVDDIIQEEVKKPRKKVK